MELLTLRSPEGDRGFQMEPIQQCEDGVHAFAAGNPSSVAGPSAVDPRLTPSSASRTAARSNELVRRLLSQRKEPDSVITGLLTLALIFGLIGFALHVVWVFAIITMALGLGFTVANSRRDRVDIVNQRADERRDSADELRR